MSLPKPEERHILLGDFLFKEMHLSVCATEVMFLDQNCAAHVSHSEVRSTWCPLGQDPGNVGAGC